MEKAAERQVVGDSLQSDNPEADETPVYNNRLSLIFSTLNGLREKTESCEWALPTANALVNGLWYEIPDYIADRIRDANSEYQRTKDYLTYQTQTFSLLLEHYKDPLDPDMFFDKLRKAIIAEQEALASSEDASDVPHGTADRETAPAEDVCNVQ